MKVRFLVLFLPLSFLLYGQGSLRKAEKFFENQNYKSAYSELLLVLKDDPENCDALYKAGYASLILDKSEDALRFMSSFVKSCNEITDEQYKRIAQAYHLNYKFDIAKSYYLKSDPARKDWKRTSELIDQVENGKKYVSTPIDAKVLNIGSSVNSSADDYLPNITADQMIMYFTSNRAGSTGGQKTVSGNYYEDIYVSYNNAGRWTTPEKLAPPINSEGHDAVIGLSHDGQTMFIYRGTNGGDIYISELKGDQWSKPKPFNYNSPNFESSACLSPDGRDLFYVSDRAGSKDIYHCSKNSSGHWSRPVRLPVAVNTRHDEESPYMHPDGKTLYFSSKGHSTMGGYDVFKAERRGRGWSSNTHLGYPINTVENDLYFRISADAKKGYYSSARKGGKGGQDIYSIVIPVKNDPNLALLKGKVRDDGSGRPLSAKITVTDNEANEVVAETRTNSKTGEFLISLPAGKNYGIKVSKDGHLFFSQNVYMSSNAGYKEVNKEIKLVKATKGSKVRLDNIFFETASFKLQKSSIPELKTLYDLLITNPDLKIEIGGHTDSRGNPDANQTLSENRAKSVAAFLIKQGISKDRLSWKGYGSTKPVATNKTADGRQQNRRTEFKIIGN